MTLKKAFLKLLTDYGERRLTSQELTQATRSLRKAYLDYGSHTPDNVETSLQFEYGKVAPSNSEGAVQGLTLKSQNELVSTILWHAYGESDIPESVAEAYPTLTKPEWNEVIRIAQMTLQATELDDSDLPGGNRSEPRVSKH